MKKNCAKHFGAGWFRDCYTVNFLGRYSATKYCLPEHTCIHWSNITGNHPIMYSLKYAKILVRRKEPFYY